MAENQPPASRPDNRQQKSDHQNRNKPNSDKSKSNQPKNNQPGSNRQNESTPGQSLKPNNQNNRYRKNKNRSGSFNRNKRKAPPVNRKQISENFVKDDFVCKCGECNQSFKMSLALVGVLEAVALRFETKPEITKGFICEKAKEKLEVIKKSYHAMGKAVDFKVPKEKIVEIFKYLETLPEIRGLGIDYEKSIIHIDTREKDPVKWAKINGEREDLTKAIRDKYGFGDEIALERKDFLTA